MKLLRANARNRLREAVEVKLRKEFHKAFYSFFPNIHKIRMKKSHVLLVLDAIISIAIIAGILYYIGADKIFAEFTNINYFYLFLSVVFIVVMHLIVSYRIKMLLEENNVHLKFKDILSSHMVGMLLSDFTPGRSGYFATAATLKYNYNAPSDKAMLAILGPQALDFIIKVTAGTLSMLYVTNYILKIGDGWFIFLGAIIMVLMIAIMLLLMFSKRFLKLFSFMFSIPLLKRVYVMMDKMQDSSHTVIKKLPELIVLLFLSLSAKAISWYFVAKSLGITLNLDFPEPIFYYFLQPTLTILEFVPSPTIAGIGLSEGGGAVLLSLFGITAAKAASFVFLARIKTTLVNLIAIPEAIKTMKNVKDSEFMEN